jgi:vancomycin resistance protein YoaR
VPVGRSWSVADMWENVVGGEEYDAVVVSVDDLLEDRLTTLAADLGDPPVEGTVTFTETGAEPTYPDPGTGLDVEAAAEAVRAAFPAQDPVNDPVELSLAVVEPEVTSAEVSRVMKEFANPAMSAPVTYVVGGERIVLKPADYAAALSVVPDDGRLEPQVDRTVLLRALRPAMHTLGARPQDATVEIVGGRPHVVPAKKGVTLDRDRIVGSFLDLVVADGSGRELEMPAKLVPPEVSTADVKALGITEKVSEFTTFYPHADYRNTNIGRAAALVDGTLLRPGETFSLNDTVGERTPENGFAKGFVISDGIFKEDYGGGVSQVATTTFNAAFFAGLEDVEHKPHSFYIDRYPVGREATVAWPTVDLRFKNDTRYGVLIQTVHVPSTLSTQGSLTVRMWSTRVWDITARTSARYAYVSPDTRYLSGAGCVPNSGYSGFQVDVIRVFHRAGDAAVDHTERMHTSYTPSDSVVCQ